MRYSCLLAGQVIPLLLATCLHSQPVPSGGPGSSPKYRVEARTVILDVVVTNKDGSPVSGLHQEDFSILEKGKQQSITSFTEYVGESHAPGRLMPAGSAKVSEDNSADELPGSLNVLLLDTLNTPIEEQQNVQAQALKFLRNMRAGPRLAVFTLSTSLGWVQGFTSDPTLMQAALTRASTLPRASPWLGKQNNADIDATKLINRPGDEAFSVASSLAQLSAQHTQSFQIDMRERLTLIQLHHLALYLSSISGRKNVIWFSGSFPLSIAPSGLSYDTDRNYSEEVRKVANLLAAARVALYPIQAQGLKSSVLYGATTVPQEAGGSNSQRQQKTLNDEIDQRLEESQTLMELAKMTGGKAFYNTNGLAKAMAAAMENGRHFYTLTYTPLNKNMNGEFRPIEVKTLKGKYRLAYRRGYYAEK